MGGVCHSKDQVVPVFEKPNIKARKANKKSNVPAVEKKNNCVVDGRHELEKQMDNSEVEVRDDAEIGASSFNSALFTPEEERVSKKSVYIPKSIWEASKMGET